MGFLGKLEVFFNKNQIKEYFKNFHNYLNGINYLNNQKIGNLSYLFITKKLFYENNEFFVDEIFKLFFNYENHLKNFFQLKNNDNKNKMKENLFYLKNGCFVWRKLINDVKKEKQQSCTSFINCYLNENNEKEVEKTFDISKLDSTLHLKKLNNLKNFNENTIWNFRDFRNIFSTNFNKLLVKSNGANGKTTQLYYLLNEWINNRLDLINDKLVLTLILKDIKIHQNLYDAIFEQNFKNIDYVNKDIVKSFFHINNKDILLLIDGADEYFLDKQDIKDIIEKSFIKFPIIVWSRNWKTEHFLDSYDTIFELKGWKIEQLREFLNIKLFNQEDTDNFINEVLQINNQLQTELFSLPCLAISIFKYKQYYTKINIKNKYHLFKNIILEIEKKLNLNKIEFNEVFMLFSKICFNEFKQNYIKISNENERLINLLKNLQNFIKFIPERRENHKNQYLIKFNHYSIHTFFAVHYIIYNFHDVLKENNKKNINFYNHLHSQIINFDKINKNNVNEISEKIFKLLDMNQGLNTVNKRMDNNSLDNHLLKRSLLLNNNRLSDLTLKNLIDKADDLLEINLNNVAVNYELLFSSLTKFSNKLESISITFPERCLQDKVEGKLIKLLSNLLSIKELTFASVNFLKCQETVLSPFLCCYNLKKLSFDNCHFLLTNNLNNDLFFSFKRIRLEYSIRKNYSSIILFNNCKINSSEIQLLNDLMKSNHSLSKIEIVGHKKTYDCLNGLIRSLEYSCHALSEISFIDCGLNENLSIQFGKLLMKVVHLEKLVLDGNTRMESGLLEIFDSLTNSKKHLKFLSLKYCKLDYYQTIALADSIKNSLTLETLILEGNQLMSYGLICIFRAFQKTGNNFKVINLNNCCLDPYQAQEFGDVLKYLPNLNNLEIQENFQISTSLNYILESIYHCNYNLIHLNLEGFNLNENQAKILSKSIKYLTCLENINLKDNYCMDDGILNIIESFSELSASLKYLNLENCSIKSNHATELSIKLKSLLLIEELNLSYNDDMEIGLNYIFTVFEHLKNSLRIIKLENCSIDSSQALVLSKSLCFMNVLENINLNKNQITENGFKEIFSSFKFCGKNLKVISLMFCNIYSESARILAENLQYCSQLNYLNLGNNPNMEMGLSEIFRVFGIFGRNLKILNLESCNINFNDGKLLGENIGFLSSLQQLNLSNNNEIKNNFKYIFEGLLLIADKLHYLNFFNCNLDTTQASYLKDVLNETFQLKEFNIGNNPLLAKDLISLFESLRSSAKQLEILHLDNLNMDDNHGKELKNFLSLNYFIKEINLKNNCLINDCFINLFEILELTGIHLETLNLENCKLTDIDINSFSVCLLSLNSLKTLNLNKNNKIQSGWRNFFNSLTNSKVLLKRLELENCQLIKNYFPNDFAFLSDIEHLNLKGNDDEKMDLFNILQYLNVSAKRLKNLNLEYCKLTTNTVNLLNSFIGSSHSLEKLFINGNLNININLILKSIETNNNNIKYIDIMNNIQDSQTGDETQSLFINHKIENINISNFRKRLSIQNYINEPKRKK